MRGDRDEGEVQQGEGGGEGGGEGAAAAGYQGGCSVRFHNNVVIFYKSAISFVSLWTSASKNSFAVVK